MKVCYVGRFIKNTATEHAITKAFQDNGVYVHQLEYTTVGANKNLALAAQSNYDLFLFSKSEQISLDVIKTIKQKKVMWIFDSLKLVERALYGQWIEYAKHMDILFTVAPCDMDIYAKEGINVCLLPQACDHNAYRDYGLKKDLDIVFAGHSYTNVQYRERKLRELQQVFPQFLVYGTRWEKVKAQTPVYGAELGKIYNRSKIVLGMNDDMAHDDYWSNRLWNSMGCKTVVMYKYAPSFEKYFEYDKHLVWWKEGDDLIGLIKKYLSQDELRLKISQESYNLIHQQHTYYHRVKELLKEIA